MTMPSLRHLRESLQSAEQRGNTELVAMFRRKIADKEADLRRKRLERAAARFLESGAMKA